MTNRPHQRIGAISNTHVGAQFESMAQRYFEDSGICLTKNYSLPIGLYEKKAHSFDLGSLDRKVIVECKSHRWTAGGKVPSAKMTVWNEAMYYFYLAPRGYRKIMFILHDRRSGDGETLLSYYQRTYPHLIPDEVEFVEFDEKTGQIMENL